MGNKERRQEKPHYDEILSGIWGDNRKRLALLSGIVAAAMAVMFGCSYFVDSLEKNRLIYTVMCILCIYIFFCSRKFKNRFMVTSTLYLFIGVMFVFGILLGTVIEPNETSVSFPILLFAMPLCFTDRPLRMNLMVLAGIIVYCLAAVVTQDSTMLQYNMTNVIPYGLLSMIICSWMMRLKFNRYELQYQYELSTEEQRAQIIEIEELNQKLEEAKSTAESANRAKSSFLFNMSHDIRTPMNAIIGFRDLLEKHQEDPEKRQYYLEKIEDSSNVLLSIINNVLEMARIEKGTLEKVETAWGAEQFNDAITSIFREMMDQKNIRFTSQVNVKNEYVYCDPIKLREVFINILSNAYKYTNPGGSVDMRLEELPSDREGYAIYQTTISDTGIGIGEDFLPHLFEEFSRENNTTDIKIEGTGLGMPIVKRLLEFMDGTIEVTSKKGVGSTFVVTIPHRIAERSSLLENSEVQFDPKQFEGKRILLSEDNDLNAEIAIEMLSEFGFLVDRAEDGMICCEKIKNAEADCYDVILMDIQMPNMNGYEATRVIRDLRDDVKANIPIIAMTANAFEEDKKEALRAGMNGHLAKPIDIPVLLGTLAGILGKSQADH